MFNIKNEVCFLKNCSQYAKRKINNTFRVCSSQISSVRHLSHPSLLRRPFRQSPNTPTNPLRWNCSLLRSCRKFKSHRKEVIGNAEICPRVKAIVSRWSFLSLKGKKRLKITIENNTYSSRIQFTFLDFKAVIVNDSCCFLVPNHSTLWTSDLKLICLITACLITQ